MRGSPPTGAKAVLLPQGQESCENTANETGGRPMAAPTVLMKCGGMTNLSVGFAASSPWEGEPRGVAVFHGLAPMGESWRAAPERGYSPHFADQRPITYVSPETMAAPTGATLPLPSKTQDFHLIRPVCALGTFPSRGRLANAFPFLALWFFDSLSS